MENLGISKETQRKSENFHFQTFYVQSIQLLILRLQFPEDY